LLEREGVRVLDVGTGTAGRYTVATIRLASDGMPDLQRLAAELGASASVLDDADARQVTA
jgi:hypothetical protein